MKRSLPVWLFWLCICVSFAAASGLAAIAWRETSKTPAQRDQEARAYQGEREAQAAEAQRRAEAERQEARHRPSPQAVPAIEALQALRSVTEAGTTYPHYSSRAADAKVVVDRYLRGAPDGAQRDAVDFAMRYYIAPRSRGA